MECRHGQTLQRKGLDPLVPPQASHSTPRKRIADVGAAVGGSAWPGDETIAGTDLAAVGLQGAGHPLAQPGHSIVHRLEQRHRRHSDSSTALATICGLTALSGCTPLMRSGCCTTSLKIVK